MIEKSIARTITFTMRDSSTGQPKTTLNAGDVIVKISKDGGAFTTTTNSPVAIQDTGVNTGEFSLLLTAPDMTADAIVIKAIAAGCIEVRPKIATESNYTTVRAGKMDNMDATVSSRSSQASVDNNSTSLAAIKGTGFDPATDSLKQIKATL